MQKQPMNRVEKVCLWGFAIYMAIAIYGKFTDCPGTAGYTECSPTEMHRLKYGH